MEMALLTGFGFVWMATLPSVFQAGDLPGQQQQGLPEELVVPPSPVLSPAEALSSLRAADGLRVELVASEPLVVDPVACVFDGEGRLWVCEMRGYMPDVDGRGEREPNGVIAILEDTDGDGRMDRRTPFLEGLVLPRAVAPCEDGALVVSPPELFFARDTDGDGRADERQVIATGMEGLHSPEHAQNAILYTHRNYYRLANAPFEFRRLGGEWVQRRTAGGGQWGLAQDDLGRIFFNTNPDPLRADLFASHYAVRNPNHGRAGGVNVRVAHDFDVFPIRMTPGVNRGYMAGVLRDDFKLARFTAACSPLIYRGDLLPDEYRGDAFVCEPAANLVKRFRIEEEGLTLTAHGVDEGGEFLASSDERFRPVHLMDGPDGALYVVDMYRGIIQHRIFVTSFLRKQILERGLEEPVGLGRIWRIVPAAKIERRARRPLSELTWTDLIARLSSANGWARDGAQRLIVEEGEGSQDAFELLSEAVRKADSEAARRHALWALSGIGALDRGVCLHALSDPSEAVRIAAVAASEPFLRDPEIQARVAALAEGAAPGGRLRHQILLSLGRVSCEAGEALMARMLTACADSSLERQAALGGLHEAELRFVERLLGGDEFSEERPGRARLLSLLARAVVNEGKSERIEALFEDLVACEEIWQRSALAEGVLSACPKTPTGEPGFLRSSREPRAHARLTEFAELLDLTAALVWPGKPGYSEEEPVRPLTDRERASFVRGQGLYAQTCSQCHRSSGRGEGGKAPSLRYSPFVLGPPGRLVRILMHGLVGAIEVSGEKWDADMPAFVAGDEDIAAIATFIRREWGHGADPITPKFVAAVRRETRRRRQPYTAEELED
ncbi:MAG: dehydrogenase [Planctomycetes bacterium]|jgi:mono/diheme cytochrome c family protein/glucose/arabinose dehydrogenase|nr:dehydrogenase [Planctomycetota bacterium]